MMAEPDGTEPRSPLWAVIPAAGSGSRMGGEQPKQYRSLAGVAVLQRAIDAMLAVPQLGGVVVVLAPVDPYWQTLPASRLGNVHSTTGGAERAESVAAGVAAVRRLAGDDAWVLVHDAARPLVDHADICRLITKVADTGAIGGLLAVPVRDTIKRAGVGIRRRSLTTVAREKLWCAQTPQLFRAFQLADALRRGGTDITDEASAMERQGHQPLLVEARSPNFKITQAQDFLLAEAWLASATDSATSPDGAPR